MEGREEEGREEDGRGEERRRGGKEKKEITVHF